MILKNLVPNNTFPCLLVLKMSETYYFLIYRLSLLLKALSKIILKLRIPTILLTIAINLLITYIIF